MLCQIEVELDDGSRVTIASDESWKTADSPIVYNTIYSGEIYDARLENPAGTSPALTIRNGRPPCWWNRPREFFPRK